MCKACPPIPSIIPISSLGRSQVILLSDFPEVHIDRLRPFTEEGHDTSTESETNEREGETSPGTGVVLPARSKTRDQLLVDMSDGEK